MEEKRPEPVVRVGQWEGGVSALGRWQGVIARRTAKDDGGRGVALGEGFDQAESKIQIDWVLICWRASAATAAAATPTPLPHLNLFLPLSVPLLSQ